MPDLGTASASNGISSTPASELHAGPAHDGLVNQTLLRPSTPTSSSLSLSPLRSSAPKLVSKNKNKNKKISANMQICTPRRTHATIRAVPPPAKTGSPPAKDAPESSELSDIDE